VVRTENVETEKNEVNEENVIIQLNDITVKKSPSLKESKKNDEQKGSVSDVKEILWPDDDEHTLTKTESRHSLSSNSSAVSDPSKTRTDRSSSSPITSPTVCHLHRKTKSAKTLSCQKDDDSTSTSPPPQPTPPPTSPTSTSPTSTSPTSTSPTSPVTKRPLSSKESLLHEEISNCREHNWNRDTLEIQRKGFNPCLVLGMGIASTHSFLKRFDVKRKTWGNFCTAIGNGYKESNPYHNACHGADVMNSVHYILDYAGLRRSRGITFTGLSSAEFFGALLGALIHDFKHPGVNTTHIKRTRHPLNLLYLDDSPLERMHIAEAYMMCANSENDKNMNIFANMTTTDYVNVRKTVITLVLATDLAHHFGFVENLKLTTTDHSTGIRNDSEKRKYVDMQLSLGARNVDNMTAMKIAIKLSDIGKRVTYLIFV
jgi:hypothetical protein